MMNHAGIGQALPLNTSHMKSSNFFGQGQNFNAWPLTLDIDNAESPANRLNLQASIVTLDTPSFLALGGVDAAYQDINPLRKHLTHTEENFTALDEVIDLRAENRAYLHGLLNFGEFDERLQAEASALLAFSHDISALPEKARARAEELVKQMSTMLNEAIGPVGGWIAYTSQEWNKADALQQAIYDILEIEAPSANDLNRLDEIAKQLGKIYADGILANEAKDAEAQIAQRTK